MSRTNPLYQSAISPRFGLLDGMLLLVIINLDIDSIEALSYIRSNSILYTELNLTASLHPLV
jgi:hypothetical protein